MNEPRTASAEDFAAGNVYQPEDHHPVISPASVAADEANANLSPEELKDLEIARLKDELAALKKDRAECIDLAEEHAAKLRDHEDLKSRAAAAKKEADVLADALSKKVRGEVQTEIDPEDDAEQDIIQFTPAAPFKYTELGAIEVEGLDWSLVEQSALSALVSTGKPAKVKPVEILSLRYVLVDVQGRVALFHQVMDGETFVNVHKVEGADRPDERSEELAGLGQYAGIPVKCVPEGGKRAVVMWLAASPMLVRIPPDAAISGTTSDDGPNPVGNRIVAHLKSSGVEQITVDALAKLLGVERDVVQRTASEDARLVYEIDGELVLLA